MPINEWNEEGRVWEEDHGRQHSLYFADPNGVILEITTPASNPVSA
jgi:catechol-2,3-dioxygenase